MLTWRPFTGETLRARPAGDTEFARRPLLHGRPDVYPSSAFTVTRNSTRSRLGKGTDRDTQGLGQHRSAVSAQPVPGAPARPLWARVPPARTWTRPLQPGWDAAGCEKSVGPGSGQFLKFKEKKSRAL